MPAAGSATIDALPDQLLGHVLALAGWHEGKSVTLVCKRWQQAFYSEPSLWRRFEMRRWDHQPLSRSQWLDWLAAKLATLQRASALVTEAELAVERSAGLWRIASAIHSGIWLSGFLGWLQPSVLRELRLDWQLPAIDAAPTLMVAGALAGFSQLTCLSLDSPLLPHPVAVAIVQLTRLRSLQCSTLQLPLGFVDAIPQQLTALTQLSLTSALPFSSVTSLTQLRQLKRLALYEQIHWVFQGLHEAHGGALQPPMPGEFAALESFNYYRGVGTFQMAGALLRSCGVQQECEDGAYRLELEGAEQLDSLQRLLSALLPPAATEQPARLGWLDISDSELDSAALHRCPQLSAVTELQLGGCTFVGGPDAVLRPLLQQMPRLVHLSISMASDDGEQAPMPFPDCLASWKGLTKLELWSALDAPLPSGPYLSDLLALVYAGPATPLPLSLKACTALEYLLLVDVPPTLADTEADGVLLHLPGLLELELMDAWMEEEVQQRLKQRLPKLTLKT